MVCKKGFDYNRKEIERQMNNEHSRGEIRSDVNLFRTLWSDHLGSYSVQRASRPFTSNLSIPSWIYKSYKALIVDQYEKFLIPINSYQSFCIHFIGFVFGGYSSSENGHKDRNCYAHYNRNCHQKRKSIILLLSIFNSFTVSRL